MNGTPKTLILCICLPSLAACGFIDDEAPIRESLEAAARTDTFPVTRSLVEGLPEPAARFLLRSGVVDRTFVRAFRSRGSGRLSLERGGSEIELSFEQYNTTALPTRHALMRGTYAPMVEMDGHDSLELGGQGRMSIRLNGLPFQETWGPEVAQAGLVASLAEAALSPSALVGPGVELEALGADALQARLTAHGITVTGVFTFTPEGEFVDFVAQRYATEGSRQVLKTWRARCDGHAQFDGVRVCARMVGIWEEEGRAPFEYAHFQYQEVEYDVFSLY
jgi:hypothetical protein